jgi:lysophospholipase L1-like esterase
MIDCHEDQEIATHPVQDDKAHRFIPRAAKLDIRWCLRKVLWILPVLAAALPRATIGAEAADRCQAPETLVFADRPLLPRTAEALSRGVLAVLAIGSSSTAGVGASSPAMSYPSQLERALRLRFPAARVSVTNAGISGEAADGAVRRLPGALASHPALVIWQLGTNDALGSVELGRFETSMSEGIALTRRAGADLILVEPQFYPAEAGKPQLGLFLRAISAAGLEDSVPVLQRHAVMRYWIDHRQFTIAQMLSPDRFHMTDASYGCLAALLASAIAGTPHRPALATPASQPGAPAAPS